MKYIYWLLIGLGILSVVLVLLFVSKSDYEALEVENSSLSSQLQQTKADLNQLQTDYNAVNSELADIKKVYPPRDFSSVEELTTWLKSNEVSEIITPGYFEAEERYSWALKVQEDALKDGYIISVDFDVPIYVACVAIIDGDFWWWYPETDELQHYEGMGKVSREL